jgi:hypothetical protein
VYRFTRIYTLKDIYIHLLHKPKTSYILKRREYYCKRAMSCLYKRDGTLFSTPIIKSNSFAIWSFDPKNLWTLEDLNPLQILICELFDSHDWIYRSFPYEFICIYHIEKLICIHSNFLQLFLCFIVVCQTLFCVNHAVCQSYIFQ